MKPKTEKALDTLYAGDPAQFIKGRDALAKELRDQGQAAEAEQVKALRKPSKAAAALNAMALGEPKAVKRYLDLADKLRKATSGKVDAKRMRELAREDGELLEELVAKVRDASGVGQTIADRVRETLQAAQVDPELGADVIAGRVEREQRAASVGLENLLAAPQAPKRSRKARPAKAEPKQDKKAEQDKKAAEAARRRRAEAKDALRAAKAEAREAAREVARAETALAKAKRDLEAAEGKVERAEAKLESLT